MADTITALDTATTDELIAALVARHRATLGQACGQLTDLEMFLIANLALSRALAAKVRAAIDAGASAYSQEHPIWNDANPDQVGEILLRALGLGGGGPLPPPFGFGPFGR